MLILSQNAGECVQLCNFQSMSRPFDECVFVLYAGATSHRTSLDNLCGFLLFKNRYHHNRYYHNSCSLYNKVRSFKRDGNIDLISILCIKFMIFI